MLHADSRPAPRLAPRLALKKSLLLHALVLGSVVALPYFHTPPKVVEPPVIQAMLVRPPVVQHTPPRPVEAPPPQPEVIDVPEPVFEPPKIALPKVKAPEKVAEKKPMPPKSILEKKALKMPVAQDDEIEALRRESREAEMERMRREMDASATAMRVSANQATIDRYSGMITQKVESKWNRPLSARSGMVVTLRISILPGGEVANVIPVGPSGDAAFDASAVEAVRRASPLPVPEDANIFRQSFRNFTMKFRPEDL
ncbi:MAG: tolA [Moraxellaceae bacterium]|jgi:colicin import membrane protein|nr:tolA [Moraxellaceae bacterium]